MKDKEKIRAEVERRRIMNFQRKQGSRSLEDMEILSFIDSLQEEPKTDWLQELKERLDSLSKEDFKKVWANYSRYGEEGSVDYNKLITMLDESLSKETKESWNERFGEEPVSKVWTDASEEPKSDKDIAVVTREGCMWSRYKLEDLDRGWKQFVNDAEIDKWAYVSDLINL